MLPTTDRFLSALRQPHKIATHVDASIDSVLVETDLPLSTGSVAVDATSGSRRQFTGTFGERSLAALFSRPGLELRIRTGVSFYGAEDTVPAGVFPVGTWKFSEGPIPGISVTAPDRFGVVSRARFTTPKQWDVAWGSATAAIGALMVGPWTDRHAIDNTVPVPVVTNLIPFVGSALSSTVWTRDRDTAITDLVTAVAGEAYFDANGNVLIRPRPTLAATPVWDADPGSSGVLISASRSRTWERVYNAVIVNGISESDTAAVVARGLAEINNSLDALWIGGPLGLSPYFYSSKAITTNLQAQAAATALLDGAVSLNATIDATCAPNPALEPGDTVRVTFTDGSTELHLIEGLTIPLTVSGDYSQALTLRSSKSDLPKESGT